MLSNTASDILDRIVKTYDVRGLVGSQLTEELVEALAAGFVDEFRLDGSTVLVGHDMRDSSPELASAFARGATRRGASIVMLGLCSTDESYFASGSLNAAAVMFTASHNPAAYNGMKFSLAGAQGISGDTGLYAIRDRAKKYLESGFADVAFLGTVTERDVLFDYAEYLRSLVNIDDIRPLKIVVDAGNGMAGLTAPAVLGRSDLPITLIPMYFELDGTFPNHEANPLDPANLVDLKAAVVAHGADLGLAFDGDADRCFLVDERGKAVDPSAVTAIVARREIARARVAGESTPSIIHNLITSRSVPELVEASGAVAVRTKVGHSLIKAEMRATGAVFGGEHSAHYYFRDFWSADNGMLAALHVLSEVGHSDKALSVLADEYTPYAISGEINSTVEDVPAARARLYAAFRDRAIFEEFDGVTAVNTVDGVWQWWFNVRASNTEPLLRLNVEARDAATMVAVRDEALSLIRA